MKKKENPPDPAWPTYTGGQLGSFQRGLQTLPNRVADILGPDRVWTNTPVTNVEKTTTSNDGKYVVTVKKNENSDEVIKIIAKSVVMTSPTRVTCTLASNLVPSAKLLDKVYSPPVASVTMAYKKEHFKELPGGTADQPLKGFGHLLPRSMKIRSLGTIWSSSLFPNRAPDDYELLLTYIGGARDRSIVDLTEDEIYEQVDADNHKILLKNDAPDGVRIGCRVWDKAIPQYRKGHVDILDAITKDEKLTPGFYLGGNYRTGVAYGDCIQYGYDQAIVVANYVQNYSIDNTKEEIKTSSPSEEEDVVAPATTTSKDEKVKQKEEEEKVVVA